VTSAQFDRLARERVTVALAGGDRSVMSREQLHDLIVDQLDVLFDERVAGLKRPWMIIPEDLTVRDLARRDDTYLADFLADYADELADELA
jgi:hypothetical protein